jgi:hypothetical protein
MESAFNDVKQLVERETNDFLNDMNLQTIAGGVITSPNPANAAQAIFTQQLTQLTDKIQKDAVSLVTKHIIMDIAANNEIWNFFGTAAKVADPDEPIGSTRFSFTERDALNSTSSPFTADLRQSAAGLRGAWYTVQGSMDASASFVSTDLKSLTRPAISRPMGPPEDHVFQRNHPCVAAGTSVQTTRMGHAETYEISVEYPFLNYRYSIDGQALNGDNGTLVLSKEVHIPEFDEDTLRPASLFVKNHTATRQVRVTFTKQRPAGDRQIELLLLSNDPRDGNYDLTLKVDAVAGGGKILPVGSVPIFFDGQEITLPAEFTKGIRGCLENFVGEKWAKSKQVTQRDLWGPVARRQRYDEVVRELDALAAVGAFETVAIEAVKVDLARVLGLKQPLH